MLKDQVAIITGSSQGIGAGMAKYFAKQGAKVVVNFPFDSEADKANEVVEAIISEGGQAIALKANVADEAEVQNMVEETVKEFGKLDILVNNAGYYKRCFNEKNDCRKL